MKQPSRASGLTRFILCGLGIIIALLGLILAPPQAGRCLAVRRIPGRHRALGVGGY